MNSKTIRNMVLTGLFIALGFVLPFFTLQIPEIGSMLLPMHLPILICGFFCGWQYGLFAGLVLPLLRSVIMTMPPLYPTALAMTFELAAYGLLAGFAYQLLLGLFRKKILAAYAGLLLSMIGGRVIWGLASWALYGLGGLTFTWQIFVAGAFINAIPGIILQIVIIPPIVLALEKLTASKPMPVVDEG